ncbi:hypothetical protein ACIOD2_32315 [Amycolatopsis sp. NPDC088138]|uniref:hypothetical protein n=1 Tax=Amycolatopsis sp. NPDC088138 TaxID=3363938 RepID=UPI00380BF9AA
MANGLRDSIRKVETYVPISSALLAMYTTTPDPADVARRRAEREAKEAHEDARHAELLAAGGLAQAVAELHSPDDRRECGGCDFDGYEAERPEWPCRTWTLLDEQADR